MLIQLSLTQVKINNGYYFKALKILILKMAVGGSRNSRKVKKIIYQIYMFLSTSNKIETFF